MKRQDYKGTGAIRYYNLYLLFEMMGVYEKLARKILKIK